jgi:hypothetical protein
MLGSHCRNHGDVTDPHNKGTTLKCTVFSENQPESGPVGTYRSVGTYEREGTFRPEGTFCLIGTFSFIGTYGLKGTFSVVGTYDDLESGQSSFTSSISERFSDRFAGNTS